jgi:Undecaprenyl-phosphate galactose phosphotransferase WbaP
MSPETQAPSLENDISYSLTSLSYVDPESDHSKHPFELYSHSPSATYSYRVMKRVFDICAVTLIAPLVLVLGAVIALLLFLDSPGPIFFSHSRIRRGGKYFSMWKFRTMCCNGAEVLERHFDQHPEDRVEWERSWKLRNDPRVSNLGAFLRRTSLDELPQIWNVLVGEMSLVGPRPIVYEEVERYGSDYAFYAAVKPGITGLWQTSGRSSLTYAERVALDRFYVENWSFWFELKILFRTIRSVASSEGAY